ncbi:MAG: phosphotransferase [Pseudomonadota bacterium]
MTEVHHSFIEKTLDRSDYELLPLAGDASARKYFRVVVDTESYVLMVWEPFQDPNRYPFLNILDHFHKHGVNVPRVLGSDPKNGFVLLEDLGDLTLERKFWEFKEQNQVLPFYKQAVEELIKIHYPATEDKESGCVAFEIEFDTAKFLWEMNYAKDNLFEKLCQLTLTAQEHEGLENEFIAICTLLDQQPKRISHRDYHSRNLMLKLGKMKVIDFQDARLGPVQYDLVSLIHDSYVRLNSESEKAILVHYLSLAADHGADFDMEEFQRIYQVQLIQRCFKACGSFSSFFNSRSDTRYLHYIAPTLVKILAKLRELNQFPTLLNVIERHKLHEFDYEALCAPSS